MTTAAPASLTRVHWHRPEWPVAVVAAAGWGALVAAAVGDPTRLLRGPTHPDASALLSHAGVMAAAMMAPLVLVPAHELAVSSLWRRRYRAVGLYLAGYLGVWIAVGAALMLGAHRLTAVVGPLAAVAAGSVVTVVVARSQGHLTRLRRCGASRPLALVGWGADRDCLDAGVRMGGRCVATSWALMLAVMVQGGLVVVAAGTAVMVLERRGVLRPARAAGWTTAVAVLAVAVTAVSLPGGAALGQPFVPHPAHRPPAAQPASTSVPPPAHIVWNVPSRSTRA